MHPFIQPVWVTALCFLFALTPNTSTALTVNEDITLVFDKTSENGRPKNFRTSKTSFRKNLLEQVERVPTRKGLDKLNISASAQFTEHTLQAILPYLSQPIIVFDLRQETHVFINGRPVSIYGEENAANKSKSDTQIEFEQNELLRQLRVMREFPVYNLTKNDLSTKINFSDPELIQTNLVESEQELLQRLGIGYRRLHVLDHHKPDDSHVDQFLSIVEKLPPNAWVHFHCRGGRGRATAHMIMFDMLHNAKELGYEEIITRHMLIGGKDYAELPGPDSWKYQAAVERGDFLRTFYEYTRDVDGYGVRSWSNWLAFKKREI